MYDNNNMEMLAGLAVLGHSSLHPHWMEVREDFRRAQKAPRSAVQKRSRFNRLFGR